MHKHAKPPPVYTWAFKSSQPRNGGEYVNYIVQLNADSTLSCNCPGWVFAKKGQPRRCKHTEDERVKADLPKIRAAVKNGEELPMIDLSTGTSVSAAIPTTPAPESKVRFGRFLEA